MFNPIRAVAGLFRKSSAQKKILAMLNGSSSPIVGNLWASNRAELVNHFKGWNFVAIDAIASAIAGMTPQHVYQREDNDTVAISKAMRGGRLLSKREMKKSLIGLQSHVSLESVPMDHDIVRLHNRPNPFDCAFTYWYRATMFLRLCGETYLWDVPNGLGLPAESWVLPSHWVWPVPGKDRLIDYYEVRPVASFMPNEGGLANWTWFGGASGKFRIPADQIIPIYLPTPHSMVGGMSPIMAGSVWTDCADSMDKSRVFKFQNDAFPSVAIVFDKDIDPETLTLQEIERIKMMVKEKYSGIHRTGEPVVLGPGMSMQILSASPRDMDYCEGFPQMRDSLMALHRTGTANVGLAEETTFAASAASASAWHTSTLKPITIHYSQVMTEYRAKKFDKDLVTYWPDTAPDDFEFEHKQRMDMIDRDMLTINEGRAQTGIEPIEKFADMTLSEVRAEFAVPKVLGGESYSGMQESDGQTAANGSDNRLAGLFKPSGNGNGAPAMLGDKSKALTKLAKRHLLAPSRNGHE